MYAAAIEASSTHTSVTVTSPITTTANAQPLRKELPIFRQAASRSNISRSSTATNCQECAFFDVGATSAAFSNSCTSSGAIGSAVNFRELRRRIINSLKLSIVLSINWCSYSRIQPTSPIPRVYPANLRQYTVRTRPNFAGGRSRPSIKGRKGSGGWGQSPRLLLILTRRGKLSPDTLFISRFSLSRRSSPPASATSSRGVHPPRRHRSRNRRSPAPTRPCGRLRRHPSP